MGDSGSRTMLYMIRHGEPAEEYHDRFYGQMDVPLSAKGERQSMAAADRLSSVDFRCVYSSDLSRACLLADHIADPLDLPVRRLEVFRERHFGRFQGLSDAEIQEKFPGLHPEWKADRVRFRAEGGENFEDLRNRIIPAVAGLVEAFEGGRIALVTHAGPIRVTLAHVLGMPLEKIFNINLDYAAITLIEFPPNGEPRLRLLNA